MAIKSKIFTSLKKKCVEIKIIFHLNSQLIQIELMLINHYGINRHSLDDFVISHSVIICLLLIVSKWILIISHIFLIFFSYGSIYLSDIRRRFGQGEVTCRTISVKNYVFFLNKCRCCKIL